MVVQRLAAATPGMVVVGSPCGKPFPGIEFLPVTGTVALLLRLRRLRPEVIEVHQQPRLAVALSFLFPRARIMLFLHNDPLTMRGLKSAFGRRLALARLHWIVCVSHYLAQRYMTGLALDPSTPSSLSLTRRSPSYSNAPEKAWMAGSSPAMTKTDSPNTVIPAKAGIFFSAPEKKDSRFRGNDGRGGNDGGSNTGPAILPNPLTLADLPPRAATRQKTILFAGRIVRDKAPDVFVAACAIALPNLPGWTAAMIGGDRFGPASPETPYVTRIRAAAQAAGIGFAGARPHAEVLDAMAPAAIVAVPSRWAEPFGLTALEAIASGAALIAADAGGLPEVAGDAALYVPPDDAAALADAIIALARNPDRRAALAAAGLARAQNFDTPVIAAALAKLR
jgi:glycosyltransferase involved in cell wall biosynthesis